MGGGQYDHIKFLKRLFSQTYLFKMAHVLKTKSTYLFRNFSVSGKKIVNKGDVYKSRSNTSINSIGSRYWQKITYTSLFILSTVLESDVMWLLSLSPNVKAIPLPASVYQYTSHTHVFQYPEYREPRRQLLPLCLLIQWKPQVILFF